MNIETELNSIISKLWNIQDIANSPRLEEKIKGIISDCQEAIRIRKDDIDMHREGYWKDAISQSRKPIKSEVVIAVNDSQYLSTNGGNITNDIDDAYVTDIDDAKLLVKEYKKEFPDIKIVEIESSRKPIKSSLEDRLIPYLEEFEEGYADALASTDEMGHNARLETFYEIFKSDYNLSDDDISKLEGAIQDIWHETEEENTEHDMGEMYGAPHGATPEEALKHFE